MTPGKSKTKLGIVEGSFDMGVDALMAGVAEAGNPGPLQKTGTTNAWLTASSVDGPGKLASGSRTLDGDQLNSDEGTTSVQDNTAVGQRPPDAQGLRSKSKTRLVVSMGDAVGYGQGGPDMMNSTRGAVLAPGVGAPELQSLPSIRSSLEMKASIFYDREALAGMRLSELRTLLTSLQERMAGVFF